MQTSHTLSVLFFQSGSLKIIFQRASLLLLALLFSTTVQFASAAEAGRFKVTGEVVDSLGEAEIYATVRVYAEVDSAKAVSLGTTDDKGYFSQALKEAGKYRLTIASVGKALIERRFELTARQPVANLGRLVAQDASTELKEVEVVAQRPLVVREIDRLAYDVKADPESSTSNLREILRKVPLVSVDNEGNIQVKGSSDFKIYRNGRPNNSYTKNAKDIFAAIPASSIKKVEVITDPGAREDAEGVGCILNIVTDSETDMKGITGSANMNLNSVSYVPHLNLWLTAQINKVTFAVSGGGGYYPKSKQVEGRSHTVTEFFEEDTRQEYSSYYASPNGQGWFGFEGSWEPDTLNLVTAEFNGWRWGLVNPEQKDFMQRFDKDGNLTMQYGTTNDVSSNNYFDFDGAVNYQRSTRRKGEAITLSYRISTSDQHEEADIDYIDMVNCDFGYTGKYYNSKLRYLEQTAQADWSRPYGKHHKLDIGAKAVFRNNHSVSDYRYPGNSLMDTHDDFTHQTTISAVYADWRGTFGKWTVRAGLRYEYSYLSAKFKNGSVGHDDFNVNLNDFAPNAAVAWNINDANTIKLSYNRNIRRPGISMLDPSRSISPTTENFGNPDLESVAYNNLNLNYSLIKNKINLDLNLSGSVSNNNFGRVQWVENGKIFSTTRNVSESRSLGMSFYFQWSIDSKTRWMMNTYLSYNHLSQPSPVNADGTTTTVKMGRWNVNPWTRFSRDLPWRLEASVSAYWWSGGFNDVYTYTKPTARNIGYSIGLSRKFLKEDRLVVRLGLNNIFGPMNLRSESVTENPGYRTLSVSTYGGRQNVTLSVNFRFGSLKAQVKKTAASINNDDVESNKKS